jgi:hypothetical protein
VKNLHIYNEKQKRKRRKRKFNIILLRFLRSIYLRGLNINSTRADVHALLRTIYILIYISSRVTADQMIDEKDLKRLKQQLDMR